MDLGSCPGPPPDDRAGGWGRPGRTERTVEEGTALKPDFWRRGPPAFLVPDPDAFALDVGAALHPAPGGREMVAVALRPTS